MRRASLWLQFVTLLKRNFKIKMRVKQATIQEILMPIYFVVLLAILKTFAYKPTAYGPLSSDKLVVTTLSPPEMPISFYVAPNITDTSILMENVKKKIPSSSYQIFKSQNEMEFAYRNLTTQDRATVIGIFFPGSSINEYALRFPYNTFTDSFKDDNQGHCRGGNGNDTSNCPANAFLFSRFAGYQTIIDASIAQIIDPNFDSMSVSVRIMPKDGTLANTEGFNIVGPLYLVMALGPFLTFLLVFLVYEKEKKIKEGMKMMGLNDLAYWFSWGVIYAGSLLFMTLIMTIIGYFGGLWGLSNFFLIFLFMFIYGISIEMLGYMLTPFFNRARTAGAVGGFLTIILSLIFLAIELTPDFPEPAIWAVSLLSPTAFAFVMGKVFYFELIGQGAHFYNLGVGPNPMYIGLVMMIVDIFLYFLLTLYLDNVVPSSYGQRKSVFYCLKPSFWFKNRQRGELSRSRGMSTRSMTSPEAYAKEDFEPVSSELAGQEAISFHKIRKVFQTKTSFGSAKEEVVAIKNFTMDILKGQITALLGHNGAGKTTLFNILTGFVPTTSGKAMVYGYDVSDSDDMDEIRRITGVCPQHDILIDYLSVVEHLETFAGLKGYEGAEKDDEIERVLRVVDLVDQRDTFAKKLSGGQKRKLSVGIAILGDPKILILDEPTAGMDPYSRRKLWDLLRSNREDRVTLLTTHFMDEADILADRKAILTKGRLRCIGSSLFLKNRFGVGYHLGVVSKSHENEHGITTCIAENIQGAKLQRSVGLEHAYTLPLAELGNFPVLFTELDKRQEELSIQSYGVSMTTLEEVFLKIGDDDEEEETANQTRFDGEGTYKSIGYNNPVEVTEDDRVAINMQNGTTPRFNPEQSEASENRKTTSIVLQMMRRTVLINLRSPGYVIFAIILPIVLEIVGSYLYTLTGTKSDASDPSLIDVTYQNNLDDYLKKSVLYKGLTGSENSTFVDNIPSGVVMEENSLSDASLLSSDEFYPHSVGLNLSVFNLTQVAYLALYNTSFTRSLPSAINLVSNAITSLLNGSQPTNIVTYSKQWPQLDSISTGFDGSSFSAALLISLSIMMPTAFAISNPVRERELKIRTQLRVSGVRFSSYWLAFLLGDYIIFLVMAVVYIICIFAFQITGLNNGGAAGALILLLIGWGVSCLLTSYAASFLFERYETAQSSWTALVPLLGMLPFIVVSTLDMTGSRDAATYINIVFLILIPYYAGFSGIYYCFRIYITSLYTGQGGDIPSSAYFDWSEPMMTLSILMPWIHIVVFAVILFVADVKKHGGDLPQCFGNQVGSSEWTSLTRNSDVDELEDEDVAQEREKISQLQHDNTEPPVVVLEGIRREFVKRTSKSCQSCRKQEEDDDATLKVAVRNLSMTVYPGEVMGLLGPNGAGKTTALNVLIADMGATAGRVSINGEVITSSLSDAYQAMGYCPQSNPLWELITLKEHLEIYSTIRGVPKNKISSTVENFMAALDIVEHKDKRSKDLSGGTKRKLCFAISMLGNPRVVLLDEPSTGMDPKTKRFLWNTISTSFEGTNRGAILTTHYMEEADALCSRVGIMVLGQLRCLGSTQHLKNKFGQGYVLELKVDRHHQDELQEEYSPDGDDSSFVQIENFVKELFPSSEVQEKFGNRLTYKIRKEDVTSLGNVFSSLEEAKTRLGIEEYSFSQSTLEQVFLRFAKEQAEKDELEQQLAQERKREKKLRKRR